MRDTPREWRRDEFTISTDRARLDLDVIHTFLASSYWATGIPRGVLERAIENSLVFGIYEDKRQIGFARGITDLATYAYLADVFVVESHRRRGLSKWLIGVCHGASGPAGTASICAVHARCAAVVRAIWLRAATW